VVLHHPAVVPHLLAGLHPAVSKAPVAKMEVPVVKRVQEVKMGALAVAKKMRDRTAPVANKAPAVSKERV
jgi:hypothetical protein